MTLVTTAGVLAVTACAAEDDAAVSSGEQALAADEAEPGAEVAGQQDVPMPGSEPLGPETEGARGPGKPTDVEHGRKLAAFGRALEKATEEWREAGKSDDEIEELGGQLRLQMMGSRP